MKSNTPSQKSNLKNRHHNGRPTLPDAEKLSKVRHVRYTASEDDTLLANAKKAGLSSVSEYIRQATLYPVIVPRLDDSEMAILRKLSGLSNNFNQFVRLCHQKGIEPLKRDAEYYLGEFRKLFSKLNS